MYTFTMCYIYIIYTYYIYYDKSILYVYIIYIALCTYHQLHA